MFNLKISESSCLIKQQTHCILAVVSDTQISMNVIVLLFLKKKISLCFCSLYRIFFGLIPFLRIRRLLSGLNGLTLLLFLDLIGHSGSISAYCSENHT